MVAETYQGIGSEQRRLPRVAILILENIDFKTKKCH